jgi:hypothetical protein
VSLQGEQIKPTKKSKSPLLQNEELIALLKEVDNELTTLNEYVLKPANNDTEYVDTS